MTDAPLHIGKRIDPSAAEKRLARRRAAERRFRFYGLFAIAVALGFLAVLIGTIIVNGAGAFRQTAIELEIHFDAEKIDPEGTRELATLRAADYQGLVKQAVRDLFPETTKRKDKKKLYKLVSSNAGYRLAEQVVATPDLLGQTMVLWLPASDLSNSLFQGNIDIDPQSESGKRYAKEVAWIERLKAEGQIDRRFNWTFFTAGDSREPEEAGIWGATVGSFLTLVVTLVASFPLGVLAALYLEEFAPKNRWTDLVEVNINNLAAVPSVIFGLLGLALFLNVFGLPRSAPLVGGLVLSLMTLPTIIIAARAALKSVPPSIREAALGMGASPLQVAVHHVLPLAMPGILTGTIIGMARALGETAPLLMIGMVAFIVDIPGSLTDPSTVLPVQIYIWSDSPERGFAEKTNAAILVLLTFLVVMNAAAVILRRKFERRW